jgi:hypothetical protein
VSNSLFTVNHAEAKGGAFEPLPIGEYEVVISGIEIGKSNGDKTKGADVLKLTLTVREDIDQPGKKRKIWDNIIFAESTIWKWQQLAKAVTFEDGQKFNTVQEVAQALAYKSVRIKNKHEVQTQGAGAGNTNDKVAFYMASKSPLAVVPGAGADPFATTPAGPATGSDDDVPFI